MPPWRRGRRARPLRRGRGRRRSCRARRPWPRPRGARGLRARTWASLFARLISHQPAVLFSRNKSAASNQPNRWRTSLFSCWWPRRWRTSCMENVARSRAAAATCSLSMSRSLNPKPESLRLRAAAGLYTRGEASEPPFHAFSLPARTRVVRLGREAAVAHHPFEGLPLDHRNHRIRVCVRIGCAPRAAPRTQHTAGGGGLLRRQQLWATSLARAPSASGLEPGTGPFRVVALFGFLPWRAGFLIPMQAQKESRDQGSRVVAAGVLRVSTTSAGEGGTRLSAGYIRGRVAGG
jgi:hypothetical protein